MFNSKIQLKHIVLMGFLCASVFLMVCGNQSGDNSSTGSAQNGTDGSFQNNTQGIANDLSGNQGGGIAQNAGSNVPQSAPSNEAIKEMSKKETPYTLSEIFNAIALPVTSIKNTDTNKDGFEDIVLTSIDNDVYVLINNKDGNFVPKGIVMPESKMQKTELPSDELPPKRDPVLLTCDTGDINNDGFTDIVLGYAGTEQEPLRIFLGDSNGQYSDQSSVSLPLLDITVPAILKLADVNNDNSLDIIVLSPGRIKIDPYGIKIVDKRKNYVLTNNGAGVFSDETFTLFGWEFADSPAMDIIVKDFTNDSLNDVVLINPSGNLLFSKSEIGFSSSSFSESVKPQQGNVKEITLDVNNDGLKDTIRIEDGKLTISYYDPNALQKPKAESDSKLSATGYVSPWKYKITGPNGLNIAPVGQKGQVVYFELSSLVPAYLWGNILVNFDFLKLKCVSIEEDPWNWYGFWVWWTDATGLPEFGGGGQYYFYDDTDKGSDWAKTWVEWYGQGSAGSVGTYDNANGTIRLYTSTYSGYTYTSPLRIGFEILDFGNADFFVKSNDFTAYDWNTLDEGTKSTVTIAQIGQCAYNEDVSKNVRVRICGPLQVETGETYLITTWGELITPKWSPGWNIYAYDIFENGVRIDGSGFKWGEVHNKNYTFSHTVAGDYVYKFRMGDRNGAHGYTWVEAEITVSVGSKLPHIDYIEPQSALPTEMIMIAGKNFDPTAPENNVVNFRGSDIQEYAHWVNEDGTVLYALVPATKEPGTTMVSVTTHLGTSNEVPLLVQDFYDGIDRIVDQLTDKIANGDYSDTAKALMGDALNKIEQIKTLYAKTTPDIEAILIKTKDVMSILIDAEKEGADVSDKFYILVAMDATLKNSTITLEQALMLIDALTSVESGSDCWNELKDAILTLLDIDKKYVKSVSQAVNAMGDFVTYLSSLQSTCPGVDFNAISKSLAESGTRYLADYADTLTTAYGADNPDAQKWQEAANTAATQLNNGDYAGALHTAGNLYHDYEGTNQYTNIPVGSFCVVRFDEVKGGMPIQASVQYALSEDKCNEQWKLLLTVRNGDDEVKDTDHAKIDAVSQMLYWTLLESVGSKEQVCQITKKLELTDLITITWAGGDVKPTGSVAEYIVPKLAPGDSKTETVNVKITDERTHKDDPYEAEIEITTTGKEDGSPDVQVSITEKAGKEDLVEDVVCGCDIALDWAKKDPIKGNGNVSAPEYFPINTPQVLVFEEEQAFTDNDEIPIHCGKGEYNCTSEETLKEFPDAIIYPWTTIGNVQMIFGASGKELIFQANAPSLAENDITFAVRPEDSGIQFPDEKDALKTRTATAVQVELDADKAVLVNDDDTDDLAMIQMTIAPLIKDAVVRLETSKIKVWDSITRTNQITTNEDWVVKKNKIWSKADGVWVPMTLYAEGVTASAAVDDVELRLVYEVNGYTFCDRKKMTVIDVEIDAEGLADSQEKDPGLFMKANSDDDDIDGIKDNIDEPIENIEWDPPVTMDDDLVKYTIEYAPVIPDGTVTLSVSADTYYPYTLPLIVVWKDPAKKERLIPPVDSTSRQITWTVGVDDIPHEIWVEGLSYSKEMIDCSIKIDYSNSLKNCNDEVGITIVDIIFTKPGLDNSPEKIDSIFTEVSDPYPTILLDNIDMEDVYFDGKFIHVLISGTIRDDLQEIVSDSIADIREVTISAYGSDITVVTFPVTKIQDSPSYFRPYASHGTFSGWIEFKPINDPEIETGSSINNITVEAKNILNKVNFASITIMTALMPSTLTTSTKQEISKQLVETASIFVVESVSMGPTIQQGKFKPLLVEVKGPLELLENDLLMGQSFGGLYDVVKVEYSPEHYLLGKEDKQTVVVVVSELPQGVNIENIKPDDILVNNKTTATLLLNNKKIVLSTIDVWELKVLTGHSTESQDQCPKPTEMISVFSILKINKDNYYYEGNAPNPTKPIYVWNGKFDEKRGDDPFQFVYKYEKFTDKLQPITNFKNGAFTLYYAWSYIDSSRIPVQDKTILPFYGLSGRKVRLIEYDYSDKTIFQPPWPTNKWSHDIKATEGCTNIYSRIALGKKIPQQDPQWIWRSDSFLPSQKVWCEVGTRLEGTNIKTDGSNDEVFMYLSKAHKLISGNYKGQKRTFPEWAATHIGLPYLYGPKDRYIGEDCVGLVMGASYSSGYKKLKIAKANDWKTKPDNYGLEPVNKGGTNAETWNAANQKEFWEYIKKLTQADIDKGVLIFHSKSFLNDIDNATHVVVVESYNAQENSVSVIEAQGWDDEAKDHQWKYIDENGKQIDNKLSFHSCAQKVIRHDYISEYLSRIQQQTGKSYIGKYWIMKVK